MASGELQLTIRTADATDAPTVAQIYVDSWNSGFSGLLPVRALTPELVARWKRDLIAPAPHRWWVADISDVLIGFVGIGPSRDPLDPDLGELYAIAVNPTWWRSGVGRILMLEALHWLKADGYCEAVLWTLAHYERGQRFYEAMGWRLDGGVRDEGRQIRYRDRL